MSGCMNRVVRQAKSLLISSGCIRNAIVCVNGRRLCFPGISRSNILRTISLDGFESYESEVVTFLKAYPSPVSVFVDGGANIGFYSVLAESYFPKGTRIVAVEPFSENRRYLKNIRKLNGLGFELVEGALDSSGGLLKQMYYPVSAGSSRLSCTASLVNRFKGTEGVFQDLDYSCEEVRTVSLEALCASEGTTLVKLDIEGNELSVLRSSERLLRRSDVDFIIEIMINDSDKNDVFALMTRYGYRGYLITNAGLVRETRPLTFPVPTLKNRTIWKNHFFSKRNEEEVRNLSMKAYGYWV